MLLVTERTEHAVHFELARAHPRKHTIGRTRLKVDDVTPPLRAQLRIHRLVAPMQRLLPRVRIIRRRARGNHELRVDFALVHKVAQLGHAHVALEIGERDKVRLGRGRDLGEVAGGDERFVHELREATGGG